jgi:hypothetical protein
MMMMMIMIMMIMMDNSWIIHGWFMDDDDINNHWLGWMLQGWVLSTGCGDWMETSRFHCDSATIRHTHQSAQRNLNLLTMAFLCKHGTNARCCTNYIYINTSIHSCHPSIHPWPSIYCTLRVARDESTNRFRFRSSPPSNHPWKR